MNPVITPVDNDHIHFGLTEDDRKLLRVMTIADGGGGGEETIMHRMCIMQAITCLTTPPEQRITKDNLPRHHGGYSEMPVCVSDKITQAMVVINDHEDTSQRQRNELKKLVEDIMNTCPVKRHVREFKGEVRVEDRRDITAAYKEAEHARWEILRPIFDEDEGIGPKLPFTRKMALIREAAAVLQVTA